MLAASLRSRTVTSRSPAITEISPLFGLLTYATTGSVPAMASASACSATIVPTAVIPAAATADLLTNPRLVRALMESSFDGFAERPVDIVLFDSRLDLTSVWRPGSRLCYRPVRRGKGNGSLDRLELIGRCRARA